MFRFLLRLLDSLIDLWFNPECPICFGPIISGVLCCNCNPIQRISDRVCSLCGVPISVDLSKCGYCSDLDDYPIEKVRSLLWFSEESRVLVHLIKYQGRYEWLSIFLEHIKSMSLPFDLNGRVIIPVPIHLNKFIRRGFNQSEILAEALSKKCKLEISLGLKKIKDTAPQSILNLDDRRLNLNNVFAWEGRYPPPEKVIIVDDIYTTGETLKACANALKRMGTQEVFAWTLFRTPI